MGTPGDNFPIGKVVQGSADTAAISDSPTATPTETEEQPDSDLDMTVLQNVPSLGIFIEQQAIPSPTKDILLDTGQETSLSLHSLEDLEKQLLLETTSDSDNSSNNVPFIDTFRNLPPQHFFTQKPTLPTEDFYTHKTNVPPNTEDYFTQSSSLHKSDLSADEKFYSPTSTQRSVISSSSDEFTIQTQKSATNIDEFFSPSTSSKSNIMQDLSLPGPSGLQTPKTAKPMPTLVKIAPKRNKKPPPSTQTPKKPYTCPICNKTFQSSAKLTTHQLVHTGGTPFKCENCKKSFSSKFKLVRHALIHSDRKPFSCTVCERTFHRKDHLKNHIKVHSPSKKVYLCERTNCKKEYTSVLSYRKHLALHSAEEGSLECKICSKVFESKPEILYHLKIHAGSRTVKNPNEKKFTCDYCERKFFTRKDVRRHLVVHTGTRNFLCQFCPQRFGRKDHLVRHIKKSHSKNYSELDTESTSFELPETPNPEVLKEPELEPEKLERELEIPESKIDISEIKLEEISEVQNLLFSRDFTELSPMLCSEPELQYMPSSSSSDLLPQATLPSDSELLTELDVIKEELEHSMTSHDVSDASELIGVQSDLETDLLQTQQLLPSDMMDSDLLRLISEGNSQLTEDDNLPLPGFSQVFKQQEPPS